MTDKADIDRTYSESRHGVPEFWADVSDYDYESVADDHNGNIEVDRGKVYRLKRRSGVAISVKQGERITVINASGSQVCDFWCFHANDVNEYMSMEHTRTHLGSVFVREGNELVSNLRRPLLKLLRDSSLGIHDTLIAACDINRYEQLGVKGYHDNCRDNLTTSMRRLGLDIRTVPCPFNIWMNVQLDPNGDISFRSPVSKASDYVTFESQEDVFIAMSACPQDITPVNGEEQRTEDLYFFIE